MQKSREIYKTKNAEWMKGEVGETKIPIVRGGGIISIKTVQWMNRGGTEMT